MLRVLSYTNYHPGLIQCFCSELLKKLYQSGGPTRMPPYLITAKDIERVYADRAVRDKIQERFDLTLQLDARYQAIAWSIIVDQYDDRDSFARVYSSRDVHEKVLGNWPKGFREVTPERLRGLMDEMCGLGVLIRTEEGYRLRSPNLLSLIGSVEKILTKLADLSAKEETKDEFIADSHRAPLDNTGHRYSPLTYAQDRELHILQYGVGLIFGSSALGLSQLPDAFRQFIPPDLPEGVLGRLKDVDTTISDGPALMDWLRQFQEEHKKYERLIAIQRASGASDAIQRQVEMALEFCRLRRKSQQQWMRVFFIFDPAATWTWLQVNEAVRNRLEDEADAVVSLQRWDREGVRLRLSLANKMDTEL